MLKWTEQTKGRNETKENKKIELAILQLTQRDQFGAIDMYTSQQKVND